MGKAQDANPPTNKPNGSPANSLQNSTRATPQEIMIEIARLEIHCPVFSPMSPESRREWIMTLCQDLAHKSLGELQFGARRYRTAVPPNKWFPTPGAWLEACKNPFDEKPRRYAELEDLPPARSPEEAEKVIRETYRKLQYFPYDEMAPYASLARKEEILSRPITPPDPITPKRKEELKKLRDLAAKMLGEVEFYGDVRPQHGEKA